MKNQLRILPLLALLVAAMLLPTACNEKESDLGLNLQDPATLYDGIHDTAYDITACTVFDDSLLTSGYSYAMVGRFTHGTYGPTEAVYYTQIGLPSEDGINFDENFHIDSVVMYYRVNAFYPASSDTSKSYNLHFQIKQLSEQLMSDTSYYGFNSLVTQGVVVYDDTKTYSERDTLISFKLNEKANRLFTTASDQAEFESQVKGLRIRMTGDSDPAAVTLDLAATSTKLTVYYHYGTDTTTHYDFVTGFKAGHFTQFVHNYAGTPLSSFTTNPHDTLRNQQELYLTPMGGSNIYLRMDDFITRFHRDHPFAVIHYAELVMPLSANAELDHPNKIYAYRKSSNGLTAPIADILDGELGSGFDGTYNSTRNCYRLRISRHVQQLLRTQTDYGTLLVLDGRRTSALSTIVNNARATGCTDPLRIEFIYTEISQN